MCTVSYIPTGQDTFILTSNRDEQRSRALAEPVQLQQGTEKKLIYPKDPQAGGTWIAASFDDRLVCLLNGAFEKHQRKIPYRKSRGLVVLDLFKSPSAEAFSQQYDFSNIEPFTMVIYEQGKLYELRRDESTTHFKILDPQKAYIWSSATLYNKAIRDLKQNAFEQWIKQEQAVSIETINTFHKTGNSPEMTKHFMLDWVEGQTVSMTNVVRTTQGFAMTYNDLVRQEATNLELTFMTNQV